MKGIELPVNVLVIVAIAVIVLLGLLTLFMGGFGGFAGTAEQTSAWSKACGSVLSGCAGDHGDNAVTSIKIGTTTVTNFSDLCIGLGKRTIGSTSLDTTLNGCNHACGCP
jgi:hypothetical protein